MDEIELRYTINVGDFTVGETVYHDRALSASGQGQMQGVEVVKIPWVGTGNNPWDYHYVDGEFVLEPIEIPVPVPEPSEQEQLRADVDFLLMMAGEV